ncbi:MAG: hypothetical protein ABW171_02550 [Steroidobacter sp.]
MTIVAPMTTARIAVLALMCVLLPASFSRAAEPAAMDFVVAMEDKPCDDANRAWSVLNQHSYLSIQVTVQWQPVGGKQKEETLVLPPQKRVPVGCAPSVKIVSAVLMQF